MEEQNIVIKYVDEYTYIIEKLIISGIQNKKFLSFDVESTGLDVKNDCITQFACVPLVNGHIIEEEAVCSYVNSPKPIPELIEKLTGVTNENIAGAPSLLEVITPVWEKYKDYVWVAQCGYEFDFLILENLCKKFGFDFSPIKLDTKTLFAFIHPEVSETISTDFLKRYYQVDATKFKRHDALGDSMLIANVLQKILEEYEKKKIADLAIKNPITIKRFAPKPLQ
jgi:DNA polymerase III epsilon subunit-like protein